MTDLLEGATDVADRGRSAGDETPEGSDGEDPQVHGQLHAVDGRHAFDDDAPDPVRMRFCQPQDAGSTIGAADEVDRAIDEVLHHGDERVDHGSRHLVRAHARVVDGLTQAAAGSVQHETAEVGHAGHDRGPRAAGVRPSVREEHRRPRASLEDTDLDTV